MFKISIDFQISCDICNPKHRAAVNRDPGRGDIARLFPPPGQGAKTQGFRMPVAIVTIAGRSLLALLFILAGAAKIAGPQPFLDHMAAHHIPGMLLPLVILLELGAGTALLFGWQMPYAAGALALFCVATAFGFHLDLADKAERTLFVKDMALAGGLMFIAAAAWQIRGVAAAG
jgi:putative oxidoreductase